MSKVVTKEPTRATESPLGESRRRRAFGIPVMFLVVFGAQFAFGMWMNARGFLWGDAMSRAMNALVTLYSTDPHLAAIGFIWMPLPILLELLWVAFYPFWPEVVSSGFASTFTTALAGGATAVLLLGISRRLGLSGWIGWPHALLISANPMLFLYAGNGMSEGIAAPFLIGAVCFSTLFWYSGQRRYVAAASLFLALGFATLYEAVPFGAALFTALVLGLLWNSESKKSAPQGRWRAVEGLGLLFLVPSVYVGVLWIGVNAVIMGDPLFFATSSYSNYGQTLAVGGGGLARSVAGDVFGTLEFVAARTAAFLIPGAFLLLLRVLDGRFWRVSTFSFTLLLLSVPFSLVAFLIYLGSSNPFLRFFMYPLFVAAGWGLYEITLSRKPRLAAVWVLTGWMVAAPVTLWTMTNPALAQEESREIQALVEGTDAAQVGFINNIDDKAPLVRYLEENTLTAGQTVALDAFQGWPVAMQMPPEYFKSFLLTPDRRFNDAIRDPKRFDVSYFLVPNPDIVPQDAIAQAYPGLWSGHYEPSTEENPKLEENPMLVEDPILEEGPTLKENRTSKADDEPGFELVKSFPDTPQQWRLYRVAG